MTDSATPRITHDERARRFHADVAGGRAVASYEREDGRMILTHTSVPEEAEGEGVGSALAREAFAYARAEGLRVTAACAFMAEYMDRHPELADLA